MGPGAVNQGSIPASEVVPDGQAAPKTGSIPASEVVPDNPNLIPVTMVGPDGKKQQVMPGDVAGMRQKNFALTPDTPRAQKMVTADGKVAYVLPNEVTNFEDNGATKILPDGRFEVKNLRSDNTEFPDSIPDVRTRAVNVIKALGPEETHKAIQAEKAYWTSKEGLKQEAKGAANVALVGGGTMASIAAPAAIAEVPGAASAGLRYLGRAALPGLEEEAGKAILRQGAKWAAKKAAVAGAGYAGIKIAKSTGLIDKLLEFF